MTSARHALYNCPGAVSWSWIGAIPIIAWYNQLNNNDISFVTRLKTNARYRVIASAGSATVSAEPCSKPKGWPAIKPSRSPAPGQNIASSGFVLPAAGRRIGYKDADTGIHYTFLTNNFTLAASTIADIYKARWQVALFFKWSKQNLKVKSFLGASKNAVMTQIWVAMCVYLLLSYIKFLNHIQPSLQQMLRLLQLNLFERRDLLELLRGESPEPPVSPNQAALVFS